VARNPLVTILTDIADYPPHFWIERQEQYVICGSRRAVDQARALGLAPSHIFQVSGMILNPRFHQPPAVDRARELIRLGLDPGRPTGIVMFGGEGSMEMVKIAKALNQSDLKTQLILLCGKHQAAARALRTIEPRIPMRIEGFTRDVPYFMSLGDYFIGKPGPGSISEALAMRLPVVVESNAWTLAHERYNAEWILEQGAGVVVSSFSKVADCRSRTAAPGPTRGIPRPSRRGSQLGRLRSSGDSGEDPFPPGSRRGQSDALASRCGRSAASISLAAAINSAPIRSFYSRFRFECQPRVRLGLIRCAAMPDTRAVPCAA